MHRIRRILRHIESNGNLPVIGVRERLCPPGAQPQRAADLVRTRKTHAGHGLWAACRIPGVDPAATEHEQPEMITSGIITIAALIEPVVSYSSPIRILKRRLRASQVLDSAHTEMGSRDRTGIAHAAEAPLRRTIRGKDRRQTCPPLDVEINEFSRREVILIAAWRHTGHPKVNKDLAAGNPNSGRGCRCRAGDRGAGWPRGARGFRR